MQKSNFIIKYKYTYMKKKIKMLSGIVQGAGPNVEVGRIRPAGRSLGTTGLKQGHKLQVMLNSVVEISVNKRVKSDLSFR